MNLITRVSVHSWSQVDLTHIIVQERVHFLHPLTHGSASQEIAQCYMPIIHGNFFVHYLQPWKAFFPTSEQKIAELTSQAMKIIRADFSVQVHFGKLWMRNALLNLRYAQIFTPKLPNINTQTEAIILGAGPSLEKGIEKIRSHRDVYTIFACDTAFPVCCTGGLMPDFFISIDPQYISYATHYVFIPFTGNCNIRHMRVSMRSTQFLFEW
ncbi:6-hydroxymethylpterin diphosphokinase MptE-like protein [Treponema pallidum]|uniref:Uncharacterized protein TP_0175 n=2 Tax=Treponema pallidum subsp. pallidum TaxID=161 RepID=Y175_TREPA|nr:6-hydroxymethylpterin diphosphokinase MptE-like protein [Treponema pallidum]O83205.1 RecName: Full=Uncharacterized protein TP_0175 [Treponema pallidum subsp. pallidum str. Nichols]AAC65165.1 predicted coding region TP0175 [Treponema pallidum subsp. pallidum str. Nichols]ACD70601.1 hypothetical protein TPASS_0175 [Treponema pallidum subsp. pallidum SS14]